MRLCRSVRFLLPPVTCSVVVLLSSRVRGWWDGAAAGRRALAHYNPCPKVCEGRGGWQCKPVCRRLVSDRNARYKKYLSSVVFTPITGSLHSDGPVNIPPTTLMRSVSLRLMGESRSRSRSLTPTLVSVTLLHPPSHWWYFFSNLFVFLTPILCLLNFIRTSPSLFFNFYQHLWHYKVVFLKLVNHGGETMYNSCSLSAFFKNTYWNNQNICLVKN